ncbi:MAG: protein kinase [Myxococcaceae bacterium]|nr:protein kinase [Myxococcaceae bacterium]MCA3011932.1 protein kinase [Myxococcaceae bacterium]
MAESLGPYTLEKRIGAGGMADVFLARGPAGVCVVKRPYAHLCANPDFVRMFLDEASILASVVHPNIARILDLGQAGGAYYLAMEYVPGFDLMTLSLEHERQGELIAPELCARIIADVAGALHHAHEACHPKTGQPLSLVHRDVTPHNVLLSTSGVVKLIDFGVARASTATHKTQAGLVKGKYPYMAPEQVSALDIDRRVDVYALGLLMYELLTNTRAIAGVTEVEQIDNARRARIRPVEELRPNLSLPLRQILASCLVPDREGRYPTALALREDLEKYLRFVGQPVGQEDLLRLCRVVAAESGHVIDPAAAPGSREASGEGGAEALGFAPTAPSLRMPALPRTDPGPPRPLSPGAGGLTPVPTEPDVPVTPARSADAASAGPRPFEETLPARGAALARWGVVAFVAAAVIAVALVQLRPGGSKRGPGPVAAAPPPAVVGVDAGPVTVPPEAGAEPARVPDVAVALAPVAVDTADSRASLPAEDRAATLDVEAELPMQVRVEGHDWGTTSAKAPLRLELTPGRHTIELVNAASFCRRQVEVVLAPGAAEAIDVKTPRGKLLMRVEPVGEFSVNGRKLPGLSAIKEAVLCDGEYSVSVSFAGVKPRTRRVRVSAGNVTEVDFGLLTQ